MSKESLLHCVADKLEVNEKTASVKLAAEEIKLPKLSYLLLITLMRKAPAVVTNEELIEEVWNGKVISEDTIQQRIKLLRQSLQDSPKTPRYIATHRGLGYQFASPIEHLSQSKNTYRLKIRLFAIAVSFVLLLLSSIIFIKEANKDPLSLSVNPQAEETETNFNSSKHSADPRARSYYFNGKDYLNRRARAHNLSAIQQFAKAITQDPNYALAYTGLTHSYVEAYSYFDGEHALLDKAIETAQQAILLRNDISETHYALAIAYQAANKYNESKVAYRNALNRHDSHWLSLNNLSYLERLSGNYQASLILAFKMLTISPRRQLGYLQVAESYRELGYLEHALQWYQVSLDYGPQNPQQQYQFCNTLITLGKLDEADKRCGEIHHWAPNDAWSYEWLAELKLQQGHENDALELYKKAWELGSNYSQFRYAYLLSNKAAKNQESQLLLAEAAQVMFSEVDQYPTNTGSILNLIEFYAVTKDKETMLFWISRLNELDFMGYQTFINNSAYQNYQSDSDFLLLVEEFKLRQESSQSQLEPSLLIMPRDIETTTFRQHSDLLYEALIKEIN